MASGIQKDMQAQSTLLPIFKATKPLGNSEPNKMSLPTEKKK